MASPKITGLLIALVWVSFFAGMFGLIVTGFTDKFGGNFDKNEIDIYNKMSSLNSSVGDVQRSAQKYDQPTGVIDVIGGYMSQAYKTLVISLKSLNLFYTLTFSGLDSLHILGVEYLKSAIVLTVTILIIIGVLAAALVKKDL